MLTNVLLAFPVCLFCSSFTFSEELKKGEKNSYRARPAPRVQEYFENSRFGLNYDSSSALAVSCSKRRQFGFLIWQLAD